MVEGYDFAGYATRANMRCSDGRTILKDAFKDCDGKKVPLVWNHRHDAPESVLGHALLENRDDGVYTYCFFNNTPSGVDAKELVQHGDMCALSIYANQLKEQAKQVIHGIIREVSLVHAGANPGAFIDSVIVHADGTVTEDHEQGIIYTGEFFELAHADEEKEEKEPEEEKTDGETAEDIYNTLTEKQKVVVEAILEEAIKADNEEKESDKKENEEEDKDDMKHNAFDKETETQGNYLSHSDGMKIVAMAKDAGGTSLRAAMQAYISENKKDLTHADGDDTPADLGFNNISTLFPEYKDVRPGAPELLTTDQGWITKVLAKVHKSPISRIRTRQVDARDISRRRAKPYTKGTEKTDAGNLDILQRTTDPVTVYIRSKLDRDDIIDITDFDVVQYLYNADRMNLNEELARQIMIGDGRNGEGETPIDKTKIRPVWHDDELYTIHRDVDIAAMRTTMNGTNSTANFGENYVYAEAVIESLLYAREKYRGSGNPDFYCTPHLVNVMLLARDLNGRRIYDNVNELKAALNVNEIITAEQFEDQTRTVTVNGVEHTKKLLGLMANLGDYSLGATKGGEITHFTDFDIRFNQEISLLETRCSGALTRVKSAIALEEDVTESASASEPAEPAEP